MKLTVIPASEIHFGNRFRKELGDIDGLAESIKLNGLINPITVHARDDLPRPALYLLLAGGRRFTAAEVAGIKEIPVRVYDRELSEDELRAIELEENIQRKDLHWTEKADLELEID